MKAKVIIENGETTIVLSPENEFETNVIDTVIGHRGKYTTHTSFEAKDQYNFLSNQRIEISIKEGK